VLGISLYILGRFRQGAAPDAVQNRFTFFGFLIFGKSICERLSGRGGKGPAEAVQMAGKGSFEF
jgi:hypothetical protein